jgi:hypothetical protein
MALHPDAGWKIQAELETQSLLFPSTPAHWNAKLMEGAASILLFPALISVRYAHYRALQLALIVRASKITIHIKVALS